MKKLIIILLSIVFTLQGCTRFTQFRYDWELYKWRKDHPFVPYQFNQGTPTKKGLNMTRYAKNTTVSCEKTRAEIERIATRYGAEEFAYKTVVGSIAMIGFKIEQRQVEFTVDLPSMTEFETTANGRDRSANVAHDHWEKACRQRWRALKLVIQAKLEAIECGIATLDQEFLAYLVLPGGGTIGDKLLPQIPHMIEANTMPRLTAAT